MGRAGGGGGLTPPVLGGLRLEGRRGVPGRVGDQGEDGGGGRPLPFWSRLPRDLGRAAGTVTHPPPPSPRPVVIGLLGGIAAGKTTVAAMLAERGFAVLDADAEARAVTADPAIVQEIAARLGQELVRDGEVDRKALAARV